MIGGHKEPVPAKPWPSTFRNGYASVRNHRQVPSKIEKELFMAGSALPNSSTAGSEPAGGRSDKDESVRAKKASCAGAAGRPGVLGGCRNRSVDEL